MLRNKAKANRFEESYRSGACKIVFSADPHAVVDPLNRKGRLAKRYRQNPPETERILLGALKQFEQYGIYFHHQAVLSGYIGDFYCPAHSLLIELDGPHHEARSRYDAIRDWHLSKRGIKTVRFDISRLRDMEALIKEIGSLLGLSINESSAD